MNRIILSRKGFDSSAGGTASPIFSDGKLFSIPIPQKFPSPTRYKDLKFNGMTGKDILKESSVKSVLPHNYCHYDPLLSKEIGIFGQASSSQTELKNNKVSSGDLFLFFGWFKQFTKKGKDLHHLFGWLQIEDIIEGNIKIKEFLNKFNIQHPHGYGDTSRYTNNAIYIAKKNLTLNLKSFPISGHGLFKKTHKDLILTEKGSSRSKWKLPKMYFLESNNIFLNRLSWKDESNCLVDCIGQGQEYILNAEDNPKIVEWAVNLIKKHG